jgi:hypothetical protein
MAKRLIILLLSFFSIASVCAGHSEITSARYPDADTVVLNDEETVTYNGDGTSRTRYFSRTKILTESGRKIESVQRFGFSARYGKAAFKEVVIEKADGTKVMLDISRLARETTDNSSMSDNIVDPLDRKIIMNVPGLEVGDVLSVLIESETSKSRFGKTFGDIFVFQGLSPVLNSSYKVEGPKNLPIVKAEIRNSRGNVKMEKFETDNSVGYVFTATNTARIFPEPSMPKLWTQAQHVLVSTVVDWKRFSQWYWELSLPHLEKTNAAISNKVSQLKTPERIFKFVSQDISYMVITMEDTSPGYAPHDVSVTFDNRYGVCRDKAALLAAMLRIAGYKAYPALINVGTKLDATVPLPFFNHAIVALEKNGSYFLMDPTNENTKDFLPAYLCNQSYLVARPEGETLLTTPVLDPEKNALNVVSHATLRGDGIAVYNAEIEFLGINDTIYRGAFAKFTDKDSFEFFERRLKTFSPAAKLVKCEITPRDARNTKEPVKVKLEGEIPDLTVIGNDKIELVLPLVSRTLGMVGYLLDGNTALDKRRYPLIFDCTAKIKENLKFDVNAFTQDTVFVPEREEISGGKFSYRRIIEKKGGVIDVEREVSINNVEFSPKDYDDMKYALDMREKAEVKRVFLGVNRTKNADVLCLDVEKFVAINDSRNYTVTNFVKNQILTYRGLKRHSEVKFDYHPSVSKVEILEAVVSNFNGEVHRLTDKEINEMDCSWAASAPRYAPSKILVINLPGVAPGSVISLKTATTYKNAPLQFYDKVYFDSFSPIEHKRVSAGEYFREEKSLKRLENESYQPDGLLWRDVDVLCHSTWEDAAEYLLPAVNVTTLEGKFTGAEEIRRWMAKNVRVAGPGLYELPLSMQLTNPLRVMEERYASRLDYIRTMVSLLKGASIRADIVFAADNADEPDELRNFDREKYPRPGKFKYPLAKVFLPEGEVFFGLENEYSQTGVSSFEGSEYFNPATKSFGIVKTLAIDKSDAMTDTISIDVRVDGSVDYSSRREVYGSEVAALRKFYSTILPEDFSKHYQKILSAVAQSATATSELQADCDSYPFKLSFSCYVPYFAQSSGNFLSVEIPSETDVFPHLSNFERNSPVEIKRRTLYDNNISVTFPKGYTKISYLPPSLEITHPMNKRKIIFSQKVKTETVDDVLKISISSKIHPGETLILTPEYAPLIKELDRKLRSRANKMIIVGK